MGLVELTRKNVWIRSVLDLETDQFLNRPQPLRPIDRGSEWRGDAPLARTRRPRCGGPTSGYVAGMGFG